MDIVGVPGVEAEAELLAAITTFFARVGLTSADVGIKVRVLQDTQMLTRVKLQASNCMALRVAAAKQVRLHITKSTHAHKHPGVEPQGAGGGAVALRRARGQVCSGEFVGGYYVCVRVCRAAACLQTELQR